MLSTVPVAKQEGLGSIKDVTKQFYKGISRIGEIELCKGNDWAGTIFFTKKGTEKELCLKL